MNSAIRLSNTYFLLLAVRHVCVCWKLQIASSDHLSFREIFLVYSLLARHVYFRDIIYFREFVSKKCTTTSGVVKHSVSVAVKMLCSFSFGLELRRQPRKLFGNIRNIATSFFFDLWMFTYLSLCNLWLLCKSQYKHTILKWFCNFVSSNLSVINATCLCQCTLQWK